MPRLLAVLFAFTAVAVVVPAPGADFTFQSGPAPVVLIELYTSEGCSSCPPAEKWLNELREDAGLWKRFVPVAFHVNYWDRLGWKDALAAPAFTAREHAYAEAWRASSVYTPCFVRNGEEWRPSGAASAGGGTGNAGTLTLRWRAGDNTGEVDYTPATTAKADFEISVALLGGGIVNDVRRGENSGRTLRHEFVALRLEKAALTAGDAGARTATVTLAPRTDLKAPRRALAAWVTRRGSLTPVQAVGGWIE